MFGWWKTRRLGAAAPPVQAAGADLLHRAVSPDVRALMLASPEPQPWSPLPALGPGPAAAGSPCLPRGSLGWVVGLQALRADAAGAARDTGLLNRLDAQLEAAGRHPQELLPHAPVAVARLCELLHGETALPAGFADQREALARVFARPLFELTGAGLAMRAAPRLWLYAEIKSAICAALCGSAAQRVEACVAALLHETGWIALLQLLDRGGLSLPEPFSEGLDAGLAARRDRLFGLLMAQWAAQWPLTPALSRLAHGPALQADGQPEPLSVLLGRADERCVAHLHGAVPRAGAPG